FVSSLGDHHRALTHAGRTQESVLDVAETDELATDLDQIIPSTVKLQLAVRPPTAIISAPIKPLALTEWVRPVCLLGLLRIVDIPAADTDPGKDDPPWGAERHEREMFINDVDTHIVDGGTQRHAISIRRPLHDFMVRIVRSLGQPVGVDELDRGLGGEPTP